MILFLRILRELYLLCCETMELLVGSVFTSGEKTVQWFELQTKFLKKTTRNFRHVVYLNGQINHKIFQGSEIIGSTKNDETKSSNGLEQSNNHSLALQSILNYFRENCYDNYLILDSDCFPIYPNWQDILLEKMSRAKDYAPSFAAAVRTENLDVFPHPCVIFMRGNIIKESWVNFTLEESTTLLRTKIVDTCCGLPMDRCYPLLRSNVFNPHPVFAAIYNHMFYHHVCGSRNMMPRAVLQGYFDHYIHPGVNELIHDELFRNLVKRPAHFINSLTGLRDNILLI
jgi:hypothetical protein